MHLQLRFSQLDGQMVDRKRILASQSKAKRAMNQSWLATSAISKLHCEGPSHPLVIMCVYVSPMEHHDGSNPREFKFGVSETTIRVWVCMCAGFISAWVQFSIRALLLASLNVEVRPDYDGIIFHDLTLSLAHMATSDGCPFWWQATQKDYKIARSPSVTVQRQQMQRSQTLIRVWILISIRIRDEAWPQVSNQFVAILRLLSAPSSSS